MKKDLEHIHSPPNCSKDYWKLLPLVIFINWPSLVTSWVVVWKIHSEMHLISCTNTHSDVTDSVNHGMVKNRKTQISWQRNIIFLRNKKILNLCLRWHILRSYCFVAEVTFKVYGVIKCLNKNLITFYFIFRSKKGMTLKLCLLIEY